MPPAVAKPLLCLPTRFKPRPENRRRHIHVLPEIREVVEQLFFLALTERLEPTRDDYHAAYVDFRAALGLNEGAMRDRMRQYGALAELESRASQACLMRLYARSASPPGRKAG